MKVDNKQELELANAISVIRNRIEIVHPIIDGDKTRLLAAIDSIEFGTIVFGSAEEASGFDDFIGCFTDCNYKDPIHKLDWAKGYLKASTNLCILNNKEHYKDCHFDDAISIVNNALNLVSG